MKAIELIRGNTAHMDDLQQCLLKHCQTFYINDLSPLCGLLF